MNVKAIVLIENCACLFVLEMYSKISLFALSIFYMLGYWGSILTGAKKEAILIIKTFDGDR